MIHYFVTAQKSTAVVGCASGNFSSPDQLNLVIAKINRLELFLVCPEGLSLLKEIKINGKIVILKAFRPVYSFKDLLFILTEKCDAFILEFDLDGNKLILQTKCHGNISDKYGSCPENGRTAVIDPQAKIIALSISEGLLKIIPLESETELRATDVRVEEHIRDFNFLHDYPNPTLILIHSDNEAAHIKTKELSVKDMLLGRTLWKQNNVEMNASMVIPIPEPIGGAIIIGKETILYHNGKSFIAVGPPILRCSQVVCYARVDMSGRRHVLGDMSGNLFMMYLETAEGTNGNELNVKDIKVELLGEITIPECICYLDNGVLFVGSRLGDSLLIKLNKNFNPEANSYISILDTFMNLAPIVDMAVISLNERRQDQIVTCSGTGKEGSLRIITNGITAHELATIELDGIKGIWPLSILSNSKKHNTLVLSFVKHTKVLALNGEDIEETELHGFISDQQTLYCSNLSESVILQASESSVRLISLHPCKEVLYEWKPPAAKSIDVVASNNLQLVCALGNSLYYLEVSGSKIIEKNKRLLKHEVACTAIMPSRNSNVGKYIAVGLWNDISVRVLMVPTLDETFCEYIVGDMIPRSIVFSFFDEQYYVFCGLGNGVIIHFLFNEEFGSLSNKNRISFGSEPILLKPFQSAKNPMIFACSDLPTIIYSFNEKLIFPPVNVPRINSMCSFDSDAFPGCVALVTDYLIIIASMKEFQKLHIRTIPLGEAPKRIAYQESSRTFGVLSYRMESQGCGILHKTDCASLRAPSKTQSQSSERNSSCSDSDFEVCNFLLFDSCTFEIMHAHQMLPNEYCLSLMSSHLGKEKNPYYIVGTAFINTEESEPTKGRIIILDVKGGKVCQLAEEPVNGACYALSELNGKIVAGIGSTVRLYEWVYEKSLRLECSHSNNILALYLKVKEDLILIGDIMRSMTLIQYKSIEGNFEEICRDFTPMWMTAIEILDDDTFLGAENSLNIFTCRKNSAGLSDEERVKIEQESSFHIGELVNVFRKGSLAVPAGVETKFPSIIVGTVSGSLAVVLSLPESKYFFIRELEERLAAHLPSVGNISHKEWRRSTHPFQEEYENNFIDGDLIEALLDLPCQEVGPLVTGFKKRGTNEDFSTEEIIKALENLSRLH